MSNKPQVYVKSCPEVNHGHYHEIYQRDLGKENAALLGKCLGTGNQTQW